MFVHRVFGRIRHGWKNRMVFVLRQTGSLQKSEGVQSAVSCKGKAGEVAGNCSSNDRLNLRTGLALELEVNMQQI